VDEVEGMIVALFVKMSINVDEYEGNRHWVNISCLVVLYNPVGEAFKSRDELFFTNG
jgi:hypothetical protein